ncbi:2OG-Fe(II) oxygenase [Candidatus Woesearchaeota archaeon]|nr:2OG-Fe(II) oxygenase [Candidatus Woesearchaeota archaeon]
MKSWLNPHYLQQSIIQKMKSSFLQNKPFPHLELHNFLQEEKAEKIKQALLQETFTVKQADLFQFSQTADLVCSNNKTIQQFRSFLCSEEFISYLQNIAGKKLKSNSLDISGTLYTDTDFLLPHDDQLEGRAIAYIYYLSTLKNGDGGTLNFYNTEKNMPTSIAKNLVPRQNTFIFFEVSKRSFHEVEEMLVKKQRVALSGWFHG